MSVRSLEVASGEAVVGAGVTTVYTVPAGRTLILKHAIVNVVGATGSEVRIGVNRAGISTVYFLFGATQAGNSSARYELWTVLEAGHLIAVQALAANFRYWLSGALLVGTA